MGFILVNLFWYKIDIFNISYVISLFVLVFISNFYLFIFSKSVAFKNIATCAEQELSFSITATSPRDM